MIRSTYRATLFALYQFTIALGILLMPVAVAATHMGVTPPLHRLVETLGDAYESASNPVAA